MHALHHLRPRGVDRRDAKIKWLSALPLLAGADRREIAELATFADVVFIPAGTVMVAPGRQAHHGYVVLTGHVEIRSGVAMLDLCGAGAIVGVQGTRAIAETVAATDVTALAISTRAMRSLIASNSSIRSALLRHLDRRIFEMEAALADRAEAIS